MIKLLYLFVCGFVLCFTFQGCEKDSLELQLDREEVIMRKIGHELLLYSNDSTSLVLPIIYEDHKYRIQFDSSFSFLPDDLVKIIDTVIKVELPYNNYIVQVEECETEQVVYSYEIDHFSSPIPGIVACSAREQPEACYELIIQFITKEERKKSSKWLYSLLIIPLLLVIAYLYLKISAQ